MLPLDQHGEAQHHVPTSDRRRYRVRFVYMNNRGSMSQRTLHQVRSHTGRFSYEKTKRTCKPLPPKNAQSHVNLLFGSGLDAFQCLPRLELENEKPGLLEEAKHHMFTVYAQKRMTYYLWPRAIEDAAMFSGMLLLASVHHDAVQNVGQTSRSAAIHAQTITLVRQNFCSAQDWRRIETLCAVTCLAAATLARGTEDSVEEYKAHRSAYEAIVQNCGGPEAMVEGNEFERTSIRMIAINTIARACELPVPGLSPVRTIILQDYEPMFEKRPPLSRTADVSFSSPIYGVEPFQMLKAFQTIEDERTKNLLRMLQHCLLYRDTGGETTDNIEERESMKRRIHHDLITVLSTDNAVEPRYCNILRLCRMTADIMARTCHLGVAMRSAVEGTALVKDIKSCLQRSNLGQLWGPNIGVFYWIVLVTHCASFGTSHYLFFHTTLMRLWFQMICQKDDWKGALKPMLMLRDFARMAEGRSSADEVTLPAVEATVVSDRSTESQ